MRSYFNKPSWASRGVENEDAEFYRRAEQTYKDIVATNNNARQLRADSPKSVSHKRRCLSNHTKQEDATGPNVEQVTETENITQMESPPAPKGTHRDLDKIFEPSTIHPVPMNAEGSTTANTHGSMPMASEALQEGTLLDSISSLPSHQISNETTDANIKGQLDDPRATTDTGASHRERHTAYENAVVQILITSEMAGTKPLIINRKMSQPLKGVRMAWCDRQKLPKEVASTVFLTWKGKRLFDVTTCRSLNIKAQSLFTKEMSLFEDCFDSDTDGYRVHMEAVTEEMFAAGHQLSPRIDDSTTPTSAKSFSQKAEPHAQQEITLKCPGFDDLKIRVSSATRASEVVGAFCKSRGISSNSAVYLAFDGDRLHPHSCLSDYEIADGDMVDVIAKKAM
ncbi:hypothetical protein BDV06DRAFT_195858 [Aspergillus oleicola]